MSKHPTLVLYSGGQTRRNERLHRELVHLARQKTDAPIRFTYIPFCADGSQTYFMRSVRRYSRFGIGEFCCLQADEKPTSAQAREALRAHIVYLAGGNTFYFLKALKKSGLIHFLQDFAARGGILAGLSAGAHILTPHIGLAGVKGLDPDENEVGLRDLKALGLAPFEVMPHFADEGRRLQTLRAYSGGSKLPVFGIPDGSGIVVQNGIVRPIGPGIRVFAGGLEIQG